MLEIAAAVGIKQPSNYCFFPSRENLVLRGRAALPHATLALVEQCTVDARGAG
jgi:hypothetical protein